MERRFISLDEVSELLDISRSQADALVRSGDLAAVEIGRRGQWRVEEAEFEAFVERMYARTRRFVGEHQHSGPTL